MRATVARRIRRLETRSGPPGGRAFLVVTAGVTLALDADSCLEILREGGFVPTRGYSVVNLCRIPEGLNADETKRYLREHGAALCRPPNFPQ
jgi:hypothetical protein